jgi:hypothetical protein
MCSLIQSRQEPVKGNLTAQPLQVDAFLTWQYPEAYPPVPFEKLRRSRISWIPLGGYLLKKDSQLFVARETFPSLCNFAPANQPSPQPLA